MGDLDSKSSKVVVGVNTSCYILEIKIEDLLRLWTNYRDTNSLNIKSKSDLIIWLLIILLNVKLLEIFFLHLSSSFVPLELFVSECSLAALKFFIKITFPIWTKSSILSFTNLIRLIEGECQDKLLVFRL